MKKVYISIGSDCGGATALQKLGRREMAFPLDWLCTYHEVSKLFATDFAGFTRDLVTEVSSYNKILNLPADYSITYNPAYAVRFYHQNGRLDYYDILLRRVSRLLRVMAESEVHCVFIRRGHSKWHHTEISNCPLKPIERRSVTDIEDMRLLVGMFC